MRYLLAGLVISLMLNVFQMVYCMKRKPKVIVQARIDTLRIYDTIYMSSAFSFFARKCDSLYVSHQSTFSSGRSILSQGEGKEKFAPKWGIGVGIGYSDRNTYYYIIGEYVLREYFSIGGYVAPARKEVGIHGVVRF